MSNLITPATNPDHPIVGHYFAGPSYVTGKTAIYLCESLDPSIGYWLVNINKSWERRNISERAIGATFHEAFERPEHWHVPAWHLSVPKTDLAPKPITPNLYGT